MKLRKRFWGILGGLALLAGRTQAGTPPQNVQQSAAPKNASANQQAAAEIAAAIAREVPDRGYAVDVEFRGGIATLRGNAASPSQLHRILRAARSRPQVQRVVSELKVGSESIQTVAFQAEPMPADAMPPSGQGLTLTPASPEFTFPTGAAPQYDAPFLPPFAWPAKAPYPNISAVQYPKHYSGAQWPNIGPFHPYPEPPLDWRKVHAYTLAGLKPIHSDQDPPPEWQCFKLRWEDGHWYLSFKEPWWARHCFLDSICHPAPDDCQPGCGGAAYHLCFPQPLCTHYYVR